jgi:hypothetical protein
MSGKQAAAARPVFPRLFRKAQACGYSRKPAPGIYFCTNDALQNDGAK